MVKSVKWGQGGAVFPIPGSCRPTPLGERAVRRLQMARTLPEDAPARLSAPETCMIQGKLPSGQGYTTGLLPDESALNRGLHPSTLTLFSWGRPRALSVITQILRHLSETLHFSKHNCTFLSCAR